MNSRSSHVNAEINGRPGVVWGNIIVPANGNSKIKIKIVRDLLQTNVKLAYGLEKKDILTPISDVSSIEIVEGRLWWLLWLGITTLFMYLIGIIFIILFFVIKQRWIIFHTESMSLILFYKKSESVEEFRQTVLAVQRQLKTPHLSKSNNSRSSVTNGLSQKSEL